MLTKYECDKIFETYLSLSVAPEQVPGRTLTERLTPKELEQAACTSYAFFCTKLRSPDSLTEEIRFACAMRESNRHWRDVKEMEGAYVSLTRTLKFHVAQKTLIYRTCMDVNFVYKTKEDANLAALRRQRIIKEVRENQTMVIKGHDRHRRAVWLSMPRRKPGDDPDAFVDVLVHMMERAVATTEALSFGRRENMVSILDCNKTTAPSVKALKMGISAIEAYYPGRLKNLVALDLSFIIQSIYNVLKPFLDPVTRSKFIIVKGAKAKDEAVSVLLDESQATPNALKRGKMSTDIDAEWFVTKVPFCRLYDDPSPPPEPTVHTVKERRKIPVPIKSPRRNRGKCRSLAVGSMTRCLTRVTLNDSARG